MSQRVFISHSSKDVDFVLAHIKPVFDHAGMFAWCSATDIPMAADWERQIRSALAQTDWFIVVLSPDAQQSEWVQSETHWALEHLRGRVIPVMARGCDPGELHLRLGTIQYIDFRSNPAQAAARLLALVDGKATPPGPQARAQPQASLDQTTIIRETRQADLRLFIQLPNGTGGERVLHVHRSATIGRAEGADLQLGDDCVSRKHAQFNVIAADQIPFVTLTDLNSANGTFVNHVRMLSEQRLAVGDLIELGNSRVELRAID
ncbi:TIR domain-containing protein [Lamprocystis purpurea]|uniref:TIR domain-containing protein n=1 Tax=Lamprocystis purpurea TaxID=61598 RepID=UPI0003764082|nr:TIR domain-containing protein [Lamprocystis purpurea]